MSKEYYHTKESVEEYIRMADGYDGKHIIKRLEKYLSADSELLELGSGPGTDWQILSKNFRVTGSDYSTEFITYLNNQNPGAQFLELDAISLITEMRFDAIYSNKVLHHLANHELESSIRRQWEILNPKGVICHSFWDGEGSEIFKGLYVNYHNMFELEDLFADYFEIKIIEHYREFEADDSIFLIGIRK